MNVQSSIAGMRLLLVEDDRELSDLLCPMLAELGLEVTAAFSVREALEKVAVDSFHLVVLDIQLPDGSGFSVASQLRRSRPQTRIIVLSCLDDPAWQVAGYDMGADLYLPKPIVPEVLGAAVRNQALRCVAGHKAGTARNWQLMDDGWRLRAPCGGDIALTLRERALLGRLFEQAGKVVSREEILAVVTAVDSSANAKNLDMLIHRLRQKVGSAGLAELPLQAVRGQGYVLMAGESREEASAESAAATPDIWQEP